MYWATHAGRYTCPTSFDAQSPNIDQTTEQTTEQKTTGCSLGVAPNHDRTTTEQQMTGRLLRVARVYRLDYILYIKAAHVFRSSRICLSRFFRAMD